MDAGTIKLLEFLNRPKSVYRIPVYQRKYEWNLEQVNQFFYDIERIISNVGYDGHFLGTIVFVKSSFPNMGTDFIIIDGQQRITTSFILLKALYDSLDAHEDHNLCEEIEETYFINKHVEPGYVRKLISVQDDREAYEELLVHGICDKPSKIHTNYKQLMYLIKHSEATPQQIYEALMKVKIVYIELEQGRKDENPQVIFESLNSTGLSLTESDLIRNYLLMNELPDEQENLYKNYWLRIERLLTNAKISDFIRDYLTMKTGNIPNKNRVYQSFKHYISYEEISSEEILEDLHKFAQYYQSLLYQSTGEKEFDEHLQIISQLRSTVAYPYLLRLFDKYYHSKQICKDEFLNILQLITSYLVRRSIVNFPTNALNKVFSAMGKEIDKSRNDMGEEEAAIDYLMGRKGSAIFPRDEKVRESILNDDLYHRNHKLVNLILGKIESLSHKELVDIEGMTVEHILPQTLTSAWRIELGQDAIGDHLLYKDTIGNLTLTNYNSELSNKDFAHKKEYYAESNIKITRDLSKYETWNRAMIQKRSLYFFEKIKVIWPMPKDKYAVSHVDELDTDTYYNVYELLTVTGKKPKSIKINNKEYRVTTWKETLITYLEYLADLDLEQYLDLPKQRIFQKLLTYDKSVFRRSEELLGIYLETNINAQGIYNYLGLLAEHYEMEDDVSIQIAK